MTVKALNNERILKSFAFRIQTTLYSPPIYSKTYIYEGLGIVLDLPLSRDFQEMKDQIEKKTSKLDHRSIGNFNPKKNTQG